MLVALGQAKVLLAPGQAEAAHRRTPGAVVLLPIGGLAARARGLAAVALGRAAPDPCSRMAATTLGGMVMALGRARLGGMVEGQLALAMGRTPPRPLLMAQTQPHRRPVAIMVASVRLRSGGPIPSGTGIAAAATASGILPCTRSRTRELTITMSFGVAAVQIVCAFAANRVAIELAVTA